LEDIKIAHQASLGLPVFLPKENGVEDIVTIISQFLMCSDSNKTKVAHC
jgi:hypothetical protein